MNKPERTGTRRKVCPFLGRTSCEPAATGTLTRTWFPPCIGETCAAYAPTEDSRAVCVRLGTDVTLTDRETGPDRAPEGRADHLPG